MANKVGSDTLKGNNCLFLVMISPETNTESVNVFLIGNNPIELSNIYDKLKNIRTKKYRAEIGFDVKGIYKKIMAFKPSCILIDDNMERSYANSLMRRLSKNKNTRDIAITVLKNKNEDSYMTDAEDYVLKTEATEERLARSITNSIRFKKMRVKLRNTYRKNKRQVIGWIN
ncbi:MAG: hypothetical protein R3345_04710 [Fulvivirga sp.]|nr:hypothetical protein [Fulvivirga sp.]